MDLRLVNDEVRYGGKAAALGEALRAGLPVPPGWALDVDQVTALSRGEGGGQLLEALLEHAGPRVAVRSSAVGEDSAGASFAGQHDTVLNVTTARGLARAVRQVRDSGRTEAALAYRARLGLPGEPRVAALVQRMVEPRCAGVMFTRDPISGEDVRVIEAAWGLGEVVVAGLVTPDRFTVARGGQVLERVPGEKDLCLHLADDGTRERPVAEAMARALCLTDPELRRLDALASTLEATFEGAHDAEWAIDEQDQLYLLQRRPITR